MNVIQCPTCRLWLLLIIIACLIGLLIGLAWRLQ